MYSNGNHNLKSSHAENYQNWNDNFKDFIIFSDLKSYDIIKSWAPVIDIILV